MFSRDPKGSASGAPSQPAIRIVPELPLESRLALARRYLADSNFNAQARPIRLSYASDPPQQRRIAEAVQTMWPACSDR